jgi:hypothetical protein
MIYSKAHKGFERNELRMNPPTRNKGIWADIKSFFLHKQEIPTLIDFCSEEERREYSRRIMQRIGMDVSQYSVLNVHRIGIEVPVRYVFEELLKWDGDSTCWPNNIAQVHRLEGRLEHILIYLFGRKRYPLGFRKSFLGLKFIPFFILSAICFQHMPKSCDHDNARYLLYETSGGYPIGFFCMYVRSPISDLDEEEQAQLFFAVGFNFYGRQSNPDLSLINKIWEKVHNRVTANILNRFKQLCEWRFQNLQSGVYIPHKPPKLHAEESS